MPELAVRGRLWLAVGALWCLLLSAPSAAHLLNRTQITLLLKPESRQLVIDLAIDLTDALGGPENYYRISHGIVDDQTLVREAFLALGAALEPEIDGEVANLSLQAFAWPDLALDGFTKPWAAPMTRLRFSAPIGAATGQVRMRVLDSFPFARPIVIAGDAPRQSFSRWVRPGQWSPGLAISAGDLSAELLAQQSSALGVGLNYGKQGFLHILPLGLDHILFVCALALAAANLRSLVLLLTSFTLAHSATLSLMVMGFVPALGAWVEWMIAASILYVGVRNLVVRDGRQGHDYPLVCGFGLLHGLGFAGALLSLGLPEEQWWVGLLSFNLGVEVGQLALVLLLYPLWRLRTRSWYRNRVLVPASLVICCFAAYWLVERSDWIMMTGAA